MTVSGILIEMMKEMILWAMWSSKWGLNKVEMAVSDKNQFDVLLTCYEQTEKCGLT